MTLDLENLALIGKGGQGEVWLVRDRAQARLLALKIVRFASWEAARRALAEILPFCSGKPNGWLLAPLDLGLANEAPEGVRRAFPAGLDGPALYVLMPHVHGPSAAELARSDPAFGWPEVVALAAQVAEKLARRPEGQAHLDLKPENILVDAESGEVFLVDAHCATSAGTAPYAAPEQRAGSAAGPAADAFALGRMLRRLAARDVRDAGRPELVPPWPEIPEAWPVERRRAVRAFTETAETLDRAAQAERADPAAAGKQFLEQSAALSGPDPKGVLRESARRKPTDRLRKEAELLGAPSQRRSPLGGEGPRPKRPRVARLSYAVVPLALAAGAVFLIRGKGRPSTPPPSPAGAAKPTAEPPAPHLSGQILRPDLARAIAEAEQPRPGHGTWSFANVSGDVTDAALGIYSTGEPVWKLAPAHAGDGAHLELARGRYSLTVHHQGGKRPQEEKLTIREGSDVIYTTDEVGEYAPVDPAKVVAARNRDRYAKNKSRLTTIDQSISQPTKLLPRNHAEDYFTVVKVEVDGPGTVTWNVTDRPCDTPNMPLADHPITIETPLNLLRQESLWACPKTPGVPFHVRVVGYPTPF